MPPRPSANDASDAAPREVPSAQVDDRRRRGPAARRERRRPRSTGDGHHLEAVTLAQLIEGELDAEAIQRDVLPHLVSLCAGCREVYEELGRWQREVWHEDAVLALLEGTAARQLWEPFAALSYAEQLAAIDDDEAEHHLWAFCRLLQRKSLAATDDDPAAGARLANLAVKV